MPKLSANCSPTTAARERIASIWLTKARLVLPCGTLPAGQLTMKGTALPASNALYLPPRQCPEGRCEPASSSARSAYPSSKTGPLSLVRMMRVLSAMPMRWSAAVIWPTVQSNWRMASPLEPIGLFPAKRACGQRGTWMSLVQRYIKKGRLASLRLVWSHSPLRQWGVFLAMFTRSSIQLIA